MTPRKFIGDELARAREAAGFKTQQALADHLGFDRTVITKAETGDRVPSAEVLAAWCEATGVDAEHYKRLADMARENDGPIPRWYEYWLEREATAHILRYWSPVIIPVVLETAAYRCAVLIAGGIDLERAEEMVKATLERQAYLERADPPEVLAVLDEMVLHRLVGSPEVMYDSLVHLAELAERPNVQILIVPASVGANAGLSGDISLASGDGSPDVLHTDAVPEGHTTESRELVRRATVVFERVRRHALPCDQSRDRIMEVANEKWKQ
ncbi:MAG: Scr1 family TA system antitoxin-like transcriptional regulator [Actinomycetota bacterium]|nr:Scr1 family TA system antitoxin-like transcriptional regulator [Actinomycetota bacterium]